MKQALLLLAAALLAGCSSTTRRTPLEIIPDMDHQPKYKAQAESGFFADGRASRRPVAGTVAQGYLKADEAFYTGSANGQYVTRVPVAVTHELVARGQERFNIYCAPCHDRTGTGRGIVALRSAWLANNLTEQRIREMPDGQIFETISHGRRTMPAYRFQIAEHDRWAIVTYVRALQRAASAPELRSELR